VRISAVAAVLVTTAALAFAVVGLAAGSGTGRHASLRLLKPTPLQLAGSHFRSRERIRVVVTGAGISATKNVRASRRGAFVASFAFGAGHCSDLQAHAIGRAGSRAVLKRPPLPACLAK